MNEAHFDLKAFGKAVEAVRVARQMTRYQVFHETGVHYSVFSKLLNGRYQAMSVHTMATLVHWAGLNPLDFIKEGYA